MPWDAIRDATPDPCDEFCMRETLLGDPLSLRKGVAESGLSVVLFDLTQVSQGVTAVGIEQVWS